MTKKMISTVVIILGFSICIFPYMYSNGAECFFIPNDCSSGKSTSFSGTAPVSTLGALIADGACSFLESFSNFLAYSKEFEAGNYDSKDTLVNALSNITAASDSYKKITEIAATFPYNDSAIDRLKKFDYDSYGKSFDVNPRVFAQVRVLLANGNVRGVFKEIEKRFRAIAGFLVPLSTDSFPGKAGLWRLNQFYAESLLFGQYAAEIFDRCR